MLRKEPERLDAVIRRLLKGTALEAGIEMAQVYEAFDKASGISGQVLGRSYKDGVLTCRMASSLSRELAVASRKDVLRKINLYLGGEVVKEIIFR